jgi:hypothetical protein
LRFLAGWTLLLDGESSPSVLVTGEACIEQLSRLLLDILWVCVLGGELQNASGARKLTDTTCIPPGSHNTSNGRPIPFVFTEDTLVLCAR